VSAGQIERWVSIFNNVDLQGDQVIPGAFTKSIAEWSSRVIGSGRVSHDWGDMWSPHRYVDTLGGTAKDCARLPLYYQRQTRSASDLQTLETQGIKGTFIRV